MKSKLKRYKIYGFTIKEISNITPWKEVARALKYYYPKTNKDTMVRYSEIFEDVKKMVWDGKVDPKEWITVHCWTDFLDEEIPEYYSIATNLYSMSFRPWREVANIKIDKKTLDNNLRPEIIAHFLWEITYYGWHEKDMDKVGKRLQKATDEIKAGTAKTISHDELMARLEKSNEKRNKKAAKAAAQKTVQSGGGSVIRLKKNK